MSINSYIHTGAVLTLMIKGKTHSITADHSNYAEIVKGLNTDNVNWTKIENLTDVTKSILTYSKGKLSVEGTEVRYKDQLLHGILADKLLDMIKDGENIAYYLKFIDNLYANTSARAIRELFGFLQKSNLPITPDGCFVAYKGINGNYTDRYTGQLDNSLGKTVEMPRNEVDDDSSRTCSYGLHVCSEEYLKGWGCDRVIICKINPKDVVSIPTDYGHSKMRVCKYEVVEETNKENADLRILNNRAVYRKGLPFAKGMEVKATDGNTYLVTSTVGKDAEFSIELRNVKDKKDKEKCSRDGRVFGYANPVLEITTISKNVKEKS